MFGKVKIGLFLILSIFMVSSVFAQADVQAQARPQVPIQETTQTPTQIQDTDADGLIDTAERQKYLTDPTKFDTDNDGFSDGAEVLNNTDPLNAADSPVIKAHRQTSTALFRPTDPVAWYLSRISGITAFILLTFVVAFGLIQTSKSLLRFRVMTVITALETHRTLAWAGLFAVVIHFSTLLFDDVLRLTLKEALLPFQVVRDFKTAQDFNFMIPISLGIFGFYTIVLLIVTSEFRGKITSMKTWRTIHYASFVGYLLFLIHGFVTGSDTQEPWMLVLYFGSFGLNVGLLLARIFKKQLFYPKRHKVVAKAADKAVTTAPVADITPAGSVPPVQNLNLSQNS